MTAPLAYLEGFTYFYGRKFFVDETVLIPRPETEDIIRIVIEILQDANSGGYRRGASPAPTSSRTAATATRKDGLARERTPELASWRICDLGTGSGIIAITLALELKNVELTALDISESSLKIAAKNRQQLAPSSNITFRKSNLFSPPPLSKDGLWKNDKYDIICANLPYVDPAWPWLDHTALAYEPKIALFAQDHGLKLIKDCLDAAPTHMKNSAYLLLEADPCQHTKIINYAKTKPLKYLETRNYVLLFQKSSQS
jgi:release factor glutamine methyltransferase